MPSPSSINFTCKVVVRVSKPRFPGATQISELLVEDRNNLKPMLNPGSNPPLGPGRKAVQGAVKGTSSYIGGDTQEAKRSPSQQFLLFWREVNLREGGYVVRLRLEVSVALDVRTSELASSQSKLRQRKPSRGHNRKSRDLPSKRKMATEGSPRGKPKS